MNYREALEFFRDRSDYDRGFISNPFAGDEAASAGLKRTALLLAALNAPDRAYPIVHVAGTKGKGSTCAFIDAVARRWGLKTGLFTTPHLHSVRERIQIDGETISEETWASATTHLSASIDQVEAVYPELGTITAFELNTALALLVFAHEKVDLAIVEVGLGGRLDATNVVTPAVAVITPISFDHQAILGETLAEIAEEKAGIIKPDIPVIVAPQPPEGKAQIVRIAEERGAPLAMAGKDWNVGYREGLAKFSGSWGDISGVQLGLRGAHQAGNAGAALAALSLAVPSKIEDTAAIIEGLRNVTWPGRFETVHHSPIVIADGAHNQASMSVLAETIREHYPSHRAIIIFGAYRDKNPTEMLAELKGLDPLVIATQSRNPRARAPATIRSSASNLGIRAVEQGTLPGAIRMALEMAGHETAIIATGSLSIVAETREFFGLGDVSQLEQEVLSG